MHVNALDNDIQCDTCEPIVFFHPESHSEVGVGKEHQSGSVLLSGVCCPLEGRAGVLFGADSVTLTLCKRGNVVSKLEMSCF